MALSYGLGLQVQQRVLRYRRDAERFEAEARQLEELSVTLAIMGAPEASQRVMVPLGPHAFMEGQLECTDSVTVLLGDNIFAKRSVAQALGILERRLERVNSNVAKARNAEQSALADLRILDEQLDVVDIQEPEEDDEDQDGADGGAIDDDDEEPEFMEDPFVPGALAPVLRERAEVRPPPAATAAAAGSPQNAAGTAAPAKPVSKFKQERMQRKGQ